MNWQSCISDKRSGIPGSKQSGPRSDYQRDYDRLIFSSAFRRLQDKTQVFPLPGNTFVHNRLTHSLEVASVGRSLAAIVGHAISQYPEIKSSAAHNFYRYDLPSVISAACLAHDVGNPAFGHSGEKAISNYFIKHQEHLIDSNTLRSHFSDLEWADLTNFEGNANALRILTHQFKGKTEGGLRLTYTTLASILKYPCGSSDIDKQKKHRKKYGYFQSEKAVIKDIATELGMIAEGNEYTYKRHPFVYLVEAADDICYRIIDMEDAHRIGIISRSVAQDAFVQLLADLNRPEHKVERVEYVLTKIGDPNEAIAYLRAISINALVLDAAEIFLDNQSSILDGSYNNTLVDTIEDRSDALREIDKLSIDLIYNHQSVIKVEIAGYNVMSELLHLLVPAVLREKKEPLDKKIIRIIPDQFKSYEDGGTPYEKAMCMIDFISGMTDGYATDLYRKVKGIDIASHE